MSKWNGNAQIFKTYVPGNPNGNGKAPNQPVKGEAHIMTFEEAENRYWNWGDLGTAVK